MILVGRRTRHTRMGRVGRTVDLPRQECLIVGVDLFDLQHRQVRPHGLVQLAGAREQLGPLQALLEQPGVTDVLVNRPDSTSSSLRHAAPATWSWAAGGRGARRIWVGATGRSSLRSIPTDTNTPVCSSSSAFRSLPNVTNCRSPCRQFLFAERRSSWRGTDQTSTPSQSFDIENVAYLRR